MLGEEYMLEYLPLFDEELAAAVRCRRVRIAEAVAGRPPYRQV
jgi:hypothetical protein